MATHVDRQMPSKAASKPLNDAMCKCLLPVNFEQDEVMCFALCRSKFPRHSLSKAFPSRVFRHSQTSAHCRPKNWAVGGDGRRAGNRGRWIATGQVHRGLLLSQAEQPLTLLEIARQSKLVPDMRTSIRRLAQQVAHDVAEGSHGGRVRKPLIHFLGKEGWANSGGG